MDYDTGDTTLAWRIWVLLFPKFELRRLRRKLPSAHRGWVPGPKTIRPETDCEYRGRLKRIAWERDAPAGSSRYGMPQYLPGAV